MNCYDFPLFASQGSHSLAPSGRRGSSGSDWLAPPTPLPTQNARPALRIETTEGEEGPRFACPYHKRSPSSKPTRRSCVYPGFRTIARLKEHLYRNHTKQRCIRCNAPFGKTADLKKHQLAEPPCKSNEYQRDYGDGLDQEQTGLLKRKNRKTDTNTEEDKWRKIYQVLFPDEQVPTPFCHGTELDDFHRYWQEHFDRVFQHKFSEVPDGCWPAPRQQMVEIQHRMVQMMRDTQDQLLLDFQAHQDDDRSSCASRASTPASSNASPLTPLTPLSFPDDPPPFAAADFHNRKRKRTEDPPEHQQQQQLLFGEVGAGEPSFDNPISLPYNPPLIVLSRAMSPESPSQACGVFAQAEGIGHLSLADNHDNNNTRSIQAHSLDDMAEFAPNFAAPLGHLPSDMMMQGPPRYDWYDPWASGGNNFRS